VVAWKAGAIVERRIGLQLLRLANVDPRRVLWEETSQLFESLAHLLHTDEVSGGHGDEHEALALVIETCCCECRISASRKHKGTIG
jgi:hypothetical protein